MSSLLDKPLQDFDKVNSAFDSTSGSVSCKCAFVTRLCSDPLYFAAFCCGYTFLRH